MQHDCTFGVEAITLHVLPDVEALGGQGRPCRILQPCRSARVGQPDLSVEPAVQHQHGVWKLDRIQGEISSCVRTAQPQALRPAWPLSPTEHAFEYWSAERSLGLTIVAFAGARLLLLVGAEMDRVACQDGLACPRFRFALAKGLRQ
jgi:hypothetical protein